MRSPSAKSSKRSRSLRTSPTLLRFGLAAVLSVGWGFAVQPAQAMKLLDTGTPTGPDFPAPSLRNTGPTFQNLAGSFSTSQTQIVHTVQAHLNPFSAQALTYAITGEDPNGLPDVGNTFFSETLTTGGPTRDWYGPTGLSWTLPAGDYWLVLIPGSGFQSSMPLGAPNPTQLAFENATSGEWAQWVGDQSAGFRVLAVPEPASAVLLVLGGLTVLLRPRRSSR